MVTVVPLDEIGRRQRGETEACFLHVAGTTRQTTVKIAKGAPPNMVTVVPLDEIGRRQRGETEACFLHVAGNDETDDCQDRQGGDRDH